MNNIESFLLAFSLFASMFVFIILNMNFDIIFFGSILCFLITSFILYLVDLEGVIK